MLDRIAHEPKIEEMPERCGVVVSTEIMENALILSLPTPRLYP